MKSFAAFTRRLFLLLFALLSLIFCVAKLDISKGVGRIIFLGMVGTGVIYFIIALLSVIIKSIGRGRIDERNAMMDAYTSVLIYSKNSNLLNLFRRVAFWGTIMLLINIFGLRIPFTMICGGPYSENVFLKGYHGFLLWSVIALVVFFILSVLFFIFFLPHYGEGTYTSVQYMGKMIVQDLITPFRVIKNLFSKAENGKKPAMYVIDFVIMVAFIAVNALAIIMTIRLL